MNYTRNRGGDSDSLERPESRAGVRLGVEVDLNLADLPIEDVGIVSAHLRALDGRALRRRSGHLERQISILNVDVAGDECVGEWVRRGIAGI